ncbi:hypothetical protein Taro_038438, partial [Colocasia esculenta]|nr:hypothetical protein [Colocasia esculenta]
MRFLSTSSLLRGLLIPNPSLLVPSPRLLFRPIRLGSAAWHPKLSAGASSARSRLLCARDPLFSAARGFPARRLSSSSSCSRGGGEGGTEMHIAAVAAAAAVEGSVAKRFWIKSREESLLPFCTPFMVCLIAGGLELDTFRRYIAQDVHFLKAFAQAYEMAGDCADDDDAKAAISELRKSVVKELKMHNSVLEVRSSDLLFTISILIHFFFGTSCRLVLTGINKGSERVGILFPPAPFIMFLPIMALEPFEANQVEDDIHWHFRDPPTYFLSSICSLRCHISSHHNEWGVDVTKEISPNPATVKYTSFLLATAVGKVDGGKAPATIATPFEKTKIAAYIVAAMTPCMRLYAFLGTEILKLLGLDVSSHPYKKWINTYASPDFEASALQIEELLDKLSISLTGEELDVTEKLYRQAVKLEIEFFYAQAVEQQTIVPLTRLHDSSEHHFVLFSDFDLTCTVVDSSAILAEIAILSAPKADLIDSNEPLARKSSVDLRNSWDALSTEYTEEHEQCIENVISGERAKAFDYEGLCKALEQLSQFEKRANMRVCESGVLKGLNVDDIIRAGERLILQDGCRNFFQNIVSKKELNVEAHILSYCWCGDLIRSALSSGDLSVLNIHANELSYKESISTGEIIKKMETPLDKVRTFKAILNNCSDTGRHFSVYIGDSVGDLLCLLEADVGIVIGSSASLRKVGSHYGVAFVPLVSGLVKKQKQLDGKESHVWKKLSGVLYTVASWAEVHAFVLGISGGSCSSPQSPKYPSTGHRAASAPDALQ